MFSLGEKVLHVHPTYTKKFVTCPDCCGHRYITCILGDESMVTVSCNLCQVAGSNTSNGKVEVVDYSYIVEDATVEGLEMKSEGLRYHLTSHYGRPPEEIFSLVQRPAAEKYAAEQQAKVEALETQAAKRKAESSKTWAWHVRYHREGLKRAEKDMAYHQSQLEYAKTIVAEEKAKLPA